MSLSDYFPDRPVQSPLVTSLHSQSISPMLRSTNFARTPKPQQMKNERIIEFEDGQHTIIDLDLLYGAEPKTNIPAFDRAQKEILKQILVDLVDISLNEYTMHYICHTEIQLGSPYSSIKKKIFEQFKQFYEYGLQSMPFRLWSEVTSEHYTVLINVLPLSLQKDLTDMRLKYMRAYTRNKIEKSLKEFQRSKNQSQKHEDKKFQMFSTQASDNDPTVLTEDEYTEIVVSDVMNTPFHSYFDEQLVNNKSKSTILSFMAYFKNHEGDVIRAFNDCASVGQDFAKATSLKNKTIENYKKPRGFPLQLGENEAYLFSFDLEVAQERLLKMKKDREKEDIKPPVKRKNLSFSEDSFFDSWDDVDSLENFERLQPIKRATLKPLNQGNISHYFIITLYELLVIFYSYVLCLFY